MRVLILSADIGEGHDAPARALRDGILARRPGAEVTIVDSMAVSSRVVRALVRDGAELVLRRLPWLFDLQYLLVARWGPSRRVAMRLASLLGRRALLAAVRESGADVVVTTYPPANQVLAVERARGTLGVPLASAITDLAALHYWAHPGCDLHLVIHEESAEEVRAIAGAGTRIEHVRGLSAEAFGAPIDRGAARAGLDLPAGVPVVTVSGGGWGVGDLRTAVHAAAGTTPDVHVVVLCGHNAALRRRLDQQFAGDDRVRTLGFTDRMPEVLAATDVLVHSTAGLTVQEALVCGARVISYGWGVGHIRINNDAYRRFGLAEVVTDARALSGAIRAALDSPGAPDLTYGRLPAAADVVLALAAR